MRLLWMRLRMEVEAREGIQEYGTPLTPTRLEEASMQEAPEFAVTCPVHTSHAVT